MVVADLGQVQLGQDAADVFLQVPSVTHSSRFGTNPAAGLSAIRSAKSASAWVDIKITAGPPSWWCPARPRARSNPLSPPSVMSTRTTSGRSSSAPPQRLRRGNGYAHDAQALPSEKTTRGMEKQPVVIHNQDTERHVNRVRAHTAPRIAASKNPVNPCAHSGPASRGPPTGGR